MHCSPNVQKNKEKKGKFMKKITKILSVIMAAVMLVAALCVSAGAESIEDTAKAIDSGKKVSFTPEVTYWDRKYKDFKVVLSEKGTLRLSITSKAEEINVKVLDSNGNTVEPSDKSASSGTASTWSGSAILRWNSAVEKFSGRLSYKSLEKGTYYVRTWLDYPNDVGKVSISFKYPQKTEEEAADGTISCLSVSLKKGESLQLGAVIEGEGAVEWSSTKKAVAAVSSDGKITAKSKGEATIEAKLGKSSVKIKVNVTE